MRVLVDMDNVLVDFDAGACRIHGFTKEQIHAKQIPGEWGLEKPMGITVEDFCGPIDAAGSLFWETLNPLPWFNDLLQFVHDFATEWYIVTDISYFKHAYVGKLHWLQRKLGDEAIDRLVPTHHKHLLANKDTILIDDKASTIAKFKYPGNGHQGGYGVLFPSIGNRLYTEASDPLRHVTKLPIFNPQS